MQRPKKSAIKLLTTLLILAFEIGCAGAPKKPSVELGVLDVPAQEVIIGNTERMSIASPEDISYVKIVAQLISQRVPMLSYDKAVSFKPDQWAILAKYIKDLERYIQDHQCRTQ